MFELYQLKAFLAVVENGTVSKAAESLHMTQPALSRSIQNLEAELGVPLFDRGKNKITLNDTGIQAAECARKLLEGAASMEDTLQAYYRANHSIAVASCAPSPALGIVEEALRKHFPAMSYRSEIIADEEPLIKALSGNDCQLAIFHRKAAEPGFVQVPVYTENLYAMIPEDVPLAKRTDGVMLSEINGEAIIPFPLKGYWNILLEEKLPDSQKIYQSSIESFHTLIHSAHMICFVSDARNDPLPGHVCIPVLDKEAHINYHLACTKAQKDRFARLFREFAAEKI